MNKVKITSVVIVSLLIGIGATNFAGAVSLTGRVEADVSKWVGIVTPNITLGNQSVTLLVNITEDGENTTYVVEDALFIELNSTDTSGREQFIMPRSIFYSVAVIRSPLDAGLLPIGGLFKRILPILEPLKSRNVVDSMIGGEKHDNITISANYEISNTTFEDGENLTMHIYIMGSIPGEVNGLAESIPIIAHKKITLEVSYADMVAPLP